MKHSMQYFIHETSNELVRSAIEVVNLILYEIVLWDLKETKKKTLEEDRSSVSIVITIIVIIIVIVFVLIKRWWNYCY